jgi:hypothetical protein
MKNAIFNYITFNKDININTINGIHSADGLYDHMETHGCWTNDELRYPY